MESLPLSKVEGDLLSVSDHLCPRGADTLSATFDVDLSSKINDRSLLFPG
jgi:hypothetical protein